MKMSSHRLVIGKIEKRHLLPSLCRYFDKTFTEMFLEKTSISFMFFGPLLILMVAMETKQEKKKKKKTLNHLSVCPR